MIAGFLRRRGSMVPDAPLVTKLARLYACEGQLYICTVRWIAEVGSPTILAETVGDDVLGQAIVAHLEAFDPDEFDLRDRQATDWPAFNASGQKSVRAFKSRAWICALEQSGLDFEVSASPVLSLKDNLATQSRVRSTDPVNIARAVRDALAGARAMRAEGAA